MLNFNMMRVFYETVRCGGITHAAEQLGITQPAASNSIKKLQHELDLTLFTKKGRRLAVSEEGRVIYEKLRKVFEVEKEIEHYISQVRQGEASHLKVGLPFVYARYLVAEIVDLFSREHPDLHLSLKSGNSLELLNQVRSKSLALSLAAQSYSDPHLEFTPFREEKLVLIASPTLGLDAETALTMEDVAAHPHIVKEKGSATGSTVTAAFRSRGLAPEVVAELDSLDAVQELVRAGKGLAFVPAISLKKPDPQIQALHLDGAELAFQTYFVTHRGVPLAAQARQFVETMEDKYCKPVVS